MEITSVPNTRTRTRYGITERKKQEIDGLTIQVNNAQYNVDQYQAMVDSLTDKSTEFEQYLSEAQAAKETALSNKNIAESVVSSVNDLKVNAKNSYDQAYQAEGKIHIAAQDMNKVVNQLIFTSEIINKLQVLINKKKEMNVYISDDMVAMIGKAGADINNAFALSLTALKSCYASLTTGKESAASTDFGSIQAGILYDKLTGTGKSEDDKETINTSILQLIKNALTKANNDYDKALKANNETTRQLEHAKGKLEKATIELNSLKSGLAAAKAAALA